MPATPTAVVASDRCPVECTSYDMDGKQIVAAGQPFGHFEVKHLTLHSAGAHGRSWPDLDMLNPFKDHESMVMQQSLWAIAR